MSIRTTQQNAISSKILKKADTGWIRNPSWLAMPTVTSSEQKFVGLVAVYPDSSFLAIGGFGAYTINWGDGVVENMAANAQANHLYDYNAAALNGSNAPVTFTDSTDTVNRTSHGYLNGMEVKFYNIVTTTGISEGQTYYVINATANTFQISSSAGGSAVALTGDGSATLLPYKQALVTIVPQAGNNLTVLDLQKKHTQTGLQTYESGWLDITLGSPNFSILVLGGITPATNFNMLERVTITNLGSITDLSYKFSNMRSLSQVVLPNTASVTNMSNMFNNCNSLTSVPLFNTANVTNMSYMFASCYSLTSVPLFNTANVTNMRQMFYNCNLLQSVPLFNTANVTNMSYMFASCYSLTSVPLFNTANVTNMSYMFNNCSSLQSVPLFNTANVTDMSYMFASCYSLTSVPLFNTANVTNMSYMFNICSSLQSVPLFNTANVTNMRQMFYNCNLLQSVPLFNTANVTDMYRMFYSCVSLQSIPELVVSAVTSSSNFTGMIVCPNLSRLKAKDFNYTFSVASCKLSAAALNEIYTNLPTKTGQTITVTGNWGTATDDPTIATGKGWTVSG